MPGDPVARTATIRPIRRRGRGPGADCRANPPTRRTPRRQALRTTGGGQRDGGSGDDSSVRAILLTTTLVTLLFAGGATAISAGGKTPHRPLPGGLEPNLQAVVPHHLGVQNTGGREYLRLANGIADVGAGPWHLHPQTVIVGEGGTTTAIQDIWSTKDGASDPGGRIVCSFATTQFEFHPAHNHWHIGSVARFAVAKATDDGRGGGIGAVFVNDLGVAQSFKTTFCLIDWVKIEDNTKTPERTYFASITTLRIRASRSARSTSTTTGSGPGDQFHRRSAGVYYLSVDVNDEGKFIESDRTNNLSWTSFRLSRESNGNAKITLISHSQCSSPNMCGEELPNR